MRTCLKSGVCKSRDNNEVTCVTRIQVAQPTVKEKLGYLLLKRYINIDFNVLFSKYYEKLLTLSLSYFVQANSKVRLRGGRDYSWIPPRLDSDVTNVGLFGKSIRQNVCYPLKELNESSQEKKILVNQPVEIGTRNVKKIKCVPIKLQKVMIPRNNIKPSYKFIQNSINSSSTLSMKKTVDIKKVLGNSRREKFYSKFTKEKSTLDRTKLENISRVSILLLYLHFLLCYYLSFLKTKQFADIFETCPVEDDIN